MITRNDDDDDESIAAIDQVIAELEVAIGERTFFGRAMLLLIRTLPETGWGEAFSRP